MFFITHRKKFYSISALLVITSIAFIAVFGLKFGIDFTGGSLIEVEYEVSHSELAQDLTDSFDELALGEYSLRNTGDNGFILRSKNLTEQERNDVLAVFSAIDENVEIKRINGIGPILGEELRTKAFLSLIVVALSIIVFIAFVFRHVSKPVSSWKYGFVSIIALAHDIIIPVGVFAVLGHTLDFEVNTLFVTALLVILGYSINDTIVVLDRVRENLKDMNQKQRYARFNEIVGKSLKDTIARSINTSLTTLLALVALYVFGGEVTRQFSLVLIIGVIAGAYSSIFLAAPLLVSFRNRMPEKAPEGAEL